jgi:hypothetical protein
MFPLSLSVILSLSKGQFCLGGPDYFVVRVRERGIASAQKVVRKICTSVKDLVLSLTAH